MKFRFNCGGSNLYLNTVNGHNIMANSAGSASKECKYDFSLDKQNPCHRAITTAGHVISEWPRFIKITSQYLPLQ